MGFFKNIGVEIKEFNPRAEYPIGTYLKTENGDIIQVIAEDEATLCKDCYFHNIHCPGMCGMHARSDKTSIIYKKM